ncbi:MAG: TonB family protein [Bacteroidetes bacterium]|nr:TonB family protein [Bacteroidota bacterium]
MNYKRAFQTVLFIVFALTNCFQVKSQSVVDTNIYTFVEIMPGYPGGHYSMHHFIASTIHYPKIAFENDITGIVYVSAIVESDGSLTNIKLLKGIGYGCDEEAIRITTLMPNWNPGVHEEKNVRVSTTIPITFQILPESTGPIYNNAHVLPVFTDSLFDFDYYISTNMRYPAGISIENIIDTVNILYVVETDGSLTNVFLRDSTSNLDAFAYEAIRIMNKLSGAFEPAYIDNMPVRVRLTVSIVFDYNKIDTIDCELISCKYEDIEYRYYKQEDVVCTVVEEMPEFPGGMNKLMTFLGKNISYPMEAKKNKEQGRVFINFVVEKDGNISNAKVMRGVSPSLNAEALRVINLMPKWKPGTQRGKPVRVSYNIPVKFTIN